MTAQTTQRLAIDVGNSRIKLGLFSLSPRGDSSRLPACVERAIVPPDQPMPWELLEQWRASSDQFARPVIAGSNPSGVERILAEWPTTLGPVPLAVSNTADLPISIRVKEPRKVGIDRLLNAIAVNELSNHATPAIVVDSGTATTVDFIAMDGTFCGGAILPGLALSAQALHHYTALLPLVSVAELGNEVPAPVGQNTREAICSGLFWGQLGAVKELIHRQAGSEAQVFITGGGGALLASFLDRATFEPHLPLQGLLIAANHWDQQ